MALVYVAGALILALGLVAIMTLAFLSWREKRMEVEKLELQQQHIVQMLREQKDYETIMEYAEADAAGLDEVDAETDADFEYDLPEKYR